MKSSWNYGSDRFGTSGIDPSKRLKHPVIRRTLRKIARTAISFPDRPPTPLNESDGGARMRNLIPSWQPNPGA